AVHARLQPRDGRRDPGQHRGDRRWHRRRPVARRGRPAPSYRLMPAALDVQDGRFLPRFSLGTSDATGASLRSAPPAMSVDAALLAAIALAGVFAPLLTPYDPNTQLDIIALRSQAPSLAHPFGTDSFSRDVLSRVLFGARVSLAISFLAVTLAALVG